MKNCLWIGSIICCLLLIAGKTYSQAKTLPEKGGRHALSLGMGYMQIRENNLHPKVHRGLNYVLSYELQESKALYIPSFQASVGFAKLATGLEESSETVNVNLQCRLDWALWNVGSKRSVVMTAGPSVGMIWDLSIYPNWDESHLYWADSYHAGISVNLIWPLENGQQLKWESHIPAISLSSRPPAYRDYKLDQITVSGILASMHSNWGFGSWHVNAFYHGKLEYRFPQGRKTNHAVSYQVSFHRQKSYGGFAYLNMNHLLSYQIFF